MNNTTVLNWSNQTKCADCNEPSTSMNGKWELCSCKRKIQSNRLDARRYLDNQAEKMKALSNSKFPRCSVGGTVGVKIPDVDRGRGDFKNVLMTVVEITDDGFYKLANERWTIEGMFSRNQFSVCSEKLVVHESISIEKSLRQLADEQSLLGGQGYKRCNCKTKCMTNKCKCKPSGNLCNSKCHSS